MGGVPKKNFGRYGGYARYGRCGGYVVTTAAGDFRPIGAPLSAGNVVPECPHHTRTSAKHRRQAPPASRASVTSNMLILRKHSSIR